MTTNQNVRNKLNKKAIYSILNGKNKQGHPVLHVEIHPQCNHHILEFELGKICGAQRDWTTPGRVQ